MHSPAVARGSDSTLVGWRTPAANCSQFVAATLRLLRRAVSRCTQGPGRVVPGTPSDPS